MPWINICQQPFAFPHVMPPDDEEADGQKKQDLFRSRLSVNEAGNRLKKQI